MVGAMDLVLPDPASTLAFGRQCAADCRPGDVLALCGGLGAGKTHFVKGLAEGLGCPVEATSPTFTLVHESFGGRLPLFHFDFYRLDTEDDLLRLGWDEYLESDGVVAAEWADRFPALMPPQTRWIEFRPRPGGGRVAVFSPSPPSSPAPANQAS